MTRTLPMIIPQPTANSGATKPTGQKAPLQPKEVWAIRVRLQLAQRIRDLALFNLAIDAKLTMECVSGSTAWSYFKSSPPVPPSVYAGRITTG